MLMMQIKHSDKIKSRCSYVGNCVIFPVQIVFFYILSRKMQILQDFRKS